MSGWKYSMMKRQNPLAVIDLSLTSSTIQTLGPSTCVSLVIAEWRNTSNEQTYTCGPGFYRGQIPHAKLIDLKVYEHGGRRTHGRLLLFEGNLEVFPEEVRAT